MFGETIYDEAVGPPRMHPRRRVPQEWDSSWEEAVELRADAPRQAAVNVARWNKRHRTDGWPFKP